MSAKSSVPVSEKDPVEAAITHAPLGEPETDEEREKLAVARVQIAAGRTRSADEVTAKIGEWRRRVEGG
jgi:hypothetical protein